MSHVTKNYANFTALSDVSIELQENEFVGLLGPNGAGKTTALNIFAGCLMPSHGEVFFKGVDIYANTIQYKSQIGFLPERPPIFAEMRVLDFLNYFSELKNAKTHLSELIETLSIKSIQNKKIQNLSRGQKQKIYLAQAFLGNPSLIILDEPTIGLDPKQVNDFRNLLQQLKGKSTVLYSSHVLSEVSQICDRIIVLNKGRVIVDKKINELLSGSEPQIQVTISVLRNANTLKEELLSVEGISQVVVEKNKLTMKCLNNEDQLALLSSTVVKGNYGLIAMNVDQFELEDIFIDLIDNKIEGR